VETVASIVCVWQTFLMEELLSPLITPFILCFRLRHKAADIIDFYHKFTVDVTGVGDVCSFAQMDVQKHGNPQVISRLNHMLMFTHHHSGLATLPSVGAIL